MASTTPKVDPAYTLAAHVIGIGINDVPAETLTATRRDVLDTFGYMLGGSGAPGIKELVAVTGRWGGKEEDRKSTRLNSSHVVISYAVCCLKKKKNKSHAHSC